MLNLLQSVSRRQLSVLSRSMMTSSMLRSSAGPLPERFEAAKSALGSLGPNDEPSNDVKLKIYALFKQATVGPCNTKKPGMMDFVGKAKWEAWNGLGSLDKDGAMNQYISTVADLTKNASPASGESSATATGTTDSADAPIVIEKKDSVLTLRLNRADKFNALTRDMYNQIAETFAAANEDPAVKTVVLTGTGKYYCSGNDLSMFSNVDPSKIAAHAKSGADLLERYVASYIDLKKPLVALVNGHAVGIAVTTLGLCDLVLAPDNATFVTPFPQVGQTPEACSSYIFPLIMGMTKATEVLQGRKLTAQEACDRNLVTRVLPAASFEAEAAAVVANLAALPPQSIQLSKKLIRDNFRDTLHRINKEECQVLEGRWQSQECFEAIMAFFSRKSKM